MSSLALRTAAITLASAWVLSSSALPAAAQGEFERMMWLVPEETSALVLVRSSALFESPIALKEGWAEQRKSAASPMANLNPESQYTVFASKIDWAGGMKKEWELALVSLSAPVTPDQIAQGEAGTVDSADATPIVWSPRGLFYVPFSPTLVGVYTPVDRQGVLRWASAASKRKDAVVSDYLRQAQREFQGDDGQFLMAFDLAYLSSPKVIKPHLARSPVVDIKQDDLDAIAETLASVQGATLRIKADTEFYGWMRFDFARSTAPLERIAKPMLLELLNNIGADVANFRDWSILVEEKSITFRGPVTNESALRLGSIVSLPTGGTAPDTDAPAPAAEPGTITAEKTKRYFDDVQALLDDLSDKDESQRQIAVFSDRFADKIDHLPILGVDPEVVDFGAKVAITLRDLAATSRGVTLNITGRATTEAAQGGTGFGGYGYYGYGYGMSIQGGTSQIAVSRITTQENVKARAYEAAVWTEMKNQSAVLRRTLTQRYGVEF